MTLFSSVLPVSLFSDHQELFKMVAVAYIYIFFFFELCISIYVTLQKVVITE